MFAILGTAGCDRKPEKLSEPAAQEAADPVPEIASTETAESGPAGQKPRTVQTSALPVLSIDGTPDTAITVGGRYSFTPSVTGAAGRQPRFAIVRKPQWAVFNATTGELSGVPEEAGRHENILIAVTDNRSQPVTLPAFTIEVFPVPSEPAAAPEFPSPEVSSLAAQLDSADPSEKYRAARTLASLGPAASGAVPALIRGLSDPNPAQQAACARALGRIGSGASEALPVLSALVGSARTDTESRLASIEALGLIASPGGVSALRTALSDPDLRTRRAAASALYLIGPDAKPAVPVLVHSLAEGNEEAARALGRIGDPSAVPALTMALSDWRTVYGAAEALRDLGPAAENAIPALEQVAASGGSTAIRDMAASALKAIRTGPSQTGTQPSAPEPGRTDASPPGEMPADGTAAGGSVPGVPQ